MERWELGIPSPLPCTDCSCLLLGHVTEPRGMTTCSINDWHWTELVGHYLLRCFSTLLVIANTNMKGSLTWKGDAKENSSTTDWTLKNVYTHCIISWAKQQDSHRQKSWAELTLPLNHTSLSSSANAMYQATPAVQIPKYPPACRNMTDQLYSLG